MKIEFDVNAVQTCILKKFSDYSEIEINELCRRIVVNSIESVDTELQENLEYIGVFKY